MNLKAAMSRKMKVILCMLLFAPLYYLLYAFLHEGGHALVALLYGAKIDEFTLGLGAHVSHHGGALTAFGEALSIAAGTLLPLIVGTIVMLFYKRAVRFPGYHFCAFAVLIGLICSVLPWVVIPVISLVTPLRPTEDVSCFLDVTGAHALVVVFAALLLIGALIFLAAVKGILSKAKELRKALPEGGKVNLRDVLTVVAVGVLVLAVAGLFISRFAGFRESKPRVLSVSIYEENVLETKDWECTFGIEETGEYSVEINVKAQGFITALRLTDENGKLYYQNFGEESAHTCVLMLDEGIYKLSLTFLTGFEPVEAFLESTGLGEMSEEDADFYRNAFSHGLGDPSVIFSVVVW